MVGSRKNRRYVYFNGMSLMKYSKFFFDRPSAQGFKKGLGITVVKPVSKNFYAQDMDTAMQVPGFDLGE